MNLLMTEINPSPKHAIDWLESQSEESSRFSKSEKTLILKRFKTLKGISEFIDIFLNGGFPDIDSPFNMGDMDKAVDRVVLAIHKNEKTLIACDYDADGLGAASVLKMGFSKLGLANVEAIISDRYKGGYGFNQQCVNEIINMKDKPGLVITVDEGSSDEDRIAYLKKEVPEIDLIVTDHHHVPERTPDSAYAFINPNKKSDRFKHKNICGAVVALFLVKAIAERLNIKADLKPLLEICAISTIGDVMPLNDALNRAIVSYGLAKANSTSGLPFWNELKKENKVIEADTIGFSLAPKINAMSRIGENAEYVIAFLTSQKSETIIQAYEKMTSCNQARKEVNEDLYQLSVSQIEEQKNNFCHVIFLKEGLSGVTGIVASRIKEETGKPVICFCPKKDGECFVTGSGRSIDGVDIRLAVEKIAEQFENSAFGGHPAACGVTLKEKNLPLFYDELEKQVKEQLNNKPPVKTCRYDFDLDENDNEIDASFSFIDSFERLKPFGHKFEKPVSKLSGKLVSVNFHANGHIMGSISHKGKDIRFVWFNGKISPETREIINLEEDVNITLIGELAINEFRGNRNLQVLVDYAMN